MDFANRGNRPAQSQQNAHNEQPAPAFQPPAKKNKSSKGMNLGKVTSIFMLLAGATLILTVLLGLVFFSGGEKEQDLILNDKYQAVFLDSQDGQVYFGKLDVYNDDLYRLADIYYVRVENPIQPEGANQASQPNISLAKLGNELHGPEDVMFISRSKVLYWENLKDDGQVVTAITEFKANGGEAPAAQQQQQATQPVGTPEQNDTPATEPEATPAP